MMFSVDGFKIRIKGNRYHKIYSHLVINPINTGTQIYQGLHQLIARQYNPNYVCVLTICKLQSGYARNIISEVALLEITIRTNKPQAHELLCRMKEISEKTATVLVGSVEIEMTYEMRPLICNQQLTR